MLGTCPDSCVSELWESLADRAGRAGAVYRSCASMQRPTRNKAFEQQWRSMPEHQGFEPDDEHLLLQEH